MLHHIVLYVVFILLAAAAPNLVANGGFDQPGTSQVQAKPWTLTPPQRVSIGQGDGKTGAAVLLHSGIDDQACQISQTVRTDGSTTYTLSFSAKTADTPSCSASSDAGLDVGLLSGQLTHVGGSNIATEWKDFSVQLTGEGTSDQVVIAGRGTCFAFLIDDVSLMQASAASTSVKRSSCSSTSTASSNSTADRRRGLRFIANPIDNPNNCATSSSGSAGSGGGTGAAPQLIPPSVLYVTVLSLYGLQVVAIAGL